MKLKCVELLIVKRLEDENVTVIVKDWRMKMLLCDCELLIVKRLEDENVTV